MSERRFLWLLNEMTDLNVSIVAYSSPLRQLYATLQSLVLSLSMAHEEGLLQTSAIIIIDNGPPRQKIDLTGLLEPITKQYPFITTVLLSGHGNIGFGAGHNLAFSKQRAKFYLVLNPDVILDKLAIAQALSFMKANTECGLISPYTQNAHGQQEFLCKRYPSLFNLMLRGFMPSLVRRFFRTRLSFYEMRQECIQDKVVYDIPIVSGCFMFMTVDVVHALKGFLPEYFLYFEDFDFSLRAAQVTRLAYVPMVAITHFGGNAAKKGRRHVSLFIRSAMTFFKQHGWKIL